jgi:hypothetical protein
MAAHAFGSQDRFDLRLETDSLGTGRCWNEEGYEEEGDTEPQRGRANNAHCNDCKRIKPTVGFLNSILKDSNI